MLSPRTPLTRRTRLTRNVLAILRVMGVMGVMGVMAPGCAGRRMEAVLRSDDPRAVLADTDAVCTAIAGGDLRAWQRPSVKSATWSLLIAHGDVEARCDAAKLIHRVWRDTVTCTVTLAHNLAPGSCRLPPLRDRTRENLRSPRNPEGIWGSVG